MTAVKESFTDDFLKEYHLRLIGDYERHSELIKSGILSFDKHIQAVFEASPPNIYPRDRIYPFFELDERVLNLDELYRNRVFNARLKGVQILSSYSRDQINSHIKEKFIPFWQSKIDMTAVQILKGVSNQVKQISPKNTLSQINFHLEEEFTEESILRLLSEHELTGLRHKLNTLIVGSKIFTRLKKLKEDE